MLTPVPVTVLTGFLGSGKTTLLNHILQGRHGIRIGILLNDFGAINIDSRLVAARDGDVVELTNGCVCCTVRDDLLVSIAALLERAPEQIIIETTGLADPVPVAAQLLDPRVQGEIRLDAIVTLVDALNFDRNLDHAEQAYAQITSGDIVLINKTDLVSTETTDRIEEGVRTLSPSARILRSVHGRVDLRLLLGLHLDHGPLAGAGDHPARHTHAEGFGSVTLTSQAPMHLARLAAVLDAVPPQIIRGKGIVATSEGSCRFIFHLVGERWTLAAGEAWRPDEARRSELVFIGKGLQEADRADLEARLRACVETHGDRSAGAEGSAHEA